MKHLKLLITAVALLLVWWATWARETFPTDYVPSTTQLQMLADLNVYRKEMGREPLEANLILMKTAQDYACKMHNWNFFGHYEPDWTGPSDRANYRWYIWLVWENAVFVWTNYSATSETMLMLWKTSQWHKDNMLTRSWNEAGFWMCWLIWVQMFWKKDIPNKYIVPSKVKETSVDDWYNPDVNFTATGTVSSSTTIVKKTVPMIWKVTEKQFLINLNKLFAKYLGWRKLYIK